MTKKKEEKDKKVVASNRKARHQYEILDVVEAGISLKGPEVKSLRAGEVRLAGAYAQITEKELFVHNLYIAPYAFNSLEEISTTRTRKLLMHKREIEKLRSRVEIKKLTLVPLEMYFLRGWAKITLGIARHKKGSDKRDSLKKKQASRELERSFKGKFKF